MYKYKKYCSKCGSKIELRDFPKKYDSDNGNLVQIIWVASCFNYQGGGKRHYKKTWKQNGESLLLSEENKRLLGQMGIKRFQRGAVPK